MVIEGKHNLSNKSFEKAVLQAAADILKDRGLSSMRSYELANGVSKNLNLPSNETTMVMNIIAPKMSVSAKIEFILFRLKSFQPEEEADGGSFITENSSPKKTVADTKRQLKEDILKIIYEKKVVPLSWLQKYFGERASLLGVSISAFLATHFSLSEVNYSSQYQLVAYPGYGSNLDSFVSVLLEENQHHPFSLDKLADRMGHETDETRVLVKKRGLGSLFLWTDHDVWSLLDVEINDAVKRRLLLCFRQHGNHPILIDDLFNCLFVGVIGSNFYSDVFLDAKQLCIKKAFSEMNELDYDYDPATKRYTKRNKDKREYSLYKMF